MIRICLQFPLLQGVKIKWKIGHWFCREFSHFSRIYFKIAYSACAFQREGTGTEGEVGFTAA